jgi:hypothetical protein
MGCGGAIRGGVLAAVVVGCACGGVNDIQKGAGFYNGNENVDVDGTDNEGRVLPPVGYPCYPHYFVGDGYVYDVHGHYYKEHDGDWSVLRSAPSAVKNQVPEVSTDPSCLPSPL